MGLVEPREAGARSGPLAPSLNRLSAQTSEFGMRFEHHLRAELCATQPLPVACSGRQLVRTLAVLAGRRADPASFAVLCRRLAARWRRSGACAAHCDAAGAALLRSLREVLGDEYDKAEEHWAELYGSAAEAMLVASAWDDGAGE